jgi:predicted RNA-binding protein with TRAM domain
MLKRDVQAFDRGVLAYSPIASLKTGTSTTFDVTVTDVGRSAQEATVTEVNGKVVYQQDVPTGGIVGIQIARCQNLTCDSESSATQPVLSPGDKATWSWQITAGRPGPAEIKLRVDTYDQGSRQTLSEEIVPVAAKVVPTAAWNQQQSHKKISNATKSGVNLVVTLGSLAGAIVAIATIVGWLVNRGRRRKRAASDVGEDDATQSKKSTASS